MLRVLSLSGGRPYLNFLSPSTACETQRLCEYVGLRTFMLWWPGWLQGMEDPLAEQRKVRLPIALSFDQFELGHLSFHHSVIDPPG